MTVPPELADSITQTLRICGDPGPLLEAGYVGGGDINQAARITTPRAAYFVKWHSAPPPRFFECEAQGLEILAGAGCVRVPGVVGAGSVPGGRTAYLVLEWVDRGSKSDLAAEALGQSLARQHLVRQARYGLDHDNYIGRLPQPNQPSDTWADFYGSQRLGAQRDLAARQGRMPAGRARMLDRLIETLNRWVDESACQPSLLHGDLWGGNWMATPDGTPLMIDPAVYMGDREADLAMTALFGGFPQTFYDAYGEVFPLAPGWRDRQPLYQLYYLLAHLNLFGEGYGGSVDAILRRYVG